MPATRAADQWRAAVVIAVGSAAAAVAVAAVAVLASGLTDSAMAGLRAATRGWLVSVGASYTVDDVTIGVIPLGATLISAGLAWGLTRLTLREPVADPVAFGAMVGGVAGVLAAIVSAATSSADHGTSFVRAAFGAFVIVGLAASWGAAQRSRIAWLGLPARWRPLAEGAATGVTGLLGAATVATLIMMALRLDRAADLWATLDPNGPALLAAMCLLALPTLVLWTCAVLLGPGFAVGQDTSVDLTGSALDQLPGFPLLAALPEPGPFGAWTISLMLLPLAAGAAAGLTACVRTAAIELGWGRVLGDGAAAGALAGLVIGLLAETARGGIGPGLLQTAGPGAGQVLLVAVPLLAAGGALGAAGTHYRSARDRSPS